MSKISNDPFIQERPKSVWKLSKFLKVARSENLQNVKSVQGLKKEFNILKDCSILGDSDFWKVCKVFYMKFQGMKRMRGLYILRFYV